MKSEVKSQFGAKSKREVNKAFAQFERRMAESKNDLERLTILDDLDGILDAEISAWILKMEEVQSENSDESEAVFNESSVHIGNINDLKLNIDSLRQQFLPGARRHYEVVSKTNPELKKTKSLQDGE